MTDWRNDDAMVNVGELRNALRKHVTSTRPLTFGGYYSFENLITEGAHEVLRKRQQHQKDELITRLTGPNSSETFTYKEIADALVRLRYGVLHADDITRDIKLHREPQWRDGDTVKDATGEVWRYSSRGSWETHPWTKFGTQSRWKPESPVRPLKKVEV